MAYVNSGMYLFWTIPWIACTLLERLSIISLPAMLTIFIQVSLRSAAIRLYLKIPSYTIGCGTILQGPFLGSELEYKSIIFYSPTIRWAPVPFGWKEILNSLDFLSKQFSSMCNAFACTCLSKNLPWRHHVLKNLNRDTSNMSLINLT